MSTIISTVRRVTGVRPHPNADKLLLASSGPGGWQTVIGKRTDGTPDFAEGELAGYIPADTVFPQALAEKLNIVNYLRSKCDAHGERVLVVRKVMLRGEPSYGFFLKADPSWIEGQDLVPVLGLRKYDPPVKTTAGDAIAEHCDFARFTDIEQMQNFSDVLVEGEKVVVTEKIHGTNCRVGVIDGVKMAGSHQVQRKMPEGDLTVNRYWFPWTISGVAHLLMVFSQTYSSVILYGEVYGSGIQYLRYGTSGPAFAAFALRLNGRYVDPILMRAVCASFGVPLVPLVGVTSYLPDKIKELAKGNSLIVGADHIREGVVVQSLEERRDQRCGRVILKCINPEYATSKEAEKADASDW